MFSIDGAAPIAISTLLFFSNFILSPTLTRSKIRMSPSSPKRKALARPVRLKSCERQYQRGYKACEACRKRKTRCDLGGINQDVFAFTGPPCAYCRRTNRECVFREERYAQKHLNTSSQVAASTTESTDAAAYNEARDPKADFQFNIINDGEIDATDLDIRCAESTYAGHINIALSEQCTERDTLSPAPQMSRRSLQISPLSNTIQGVSTSSQTRPTRKEEAGHSHPPRSVVSQQSQTLPPLSNMRPWNSHLTNVVMRTLISKGNDPLNVLFDATTEGEGTFPSSTSIGTISGTDNDTLSVWSSCKLVKMGLLSADQAVMYVDAFFRNLSPKSPVLTNYFADHATHRQLVLHEPFLCSTILMISSRYHTLSGTASSSRGHYIHDKLWSHTQDALQQISLGQGRVFNYPLRSIGSVEALLLLSEWYPRAMQFTTSRYEWDTEESVADHSSSTPSSKWVEDLIEPCRRFDRMSWMILGSAHMLAHELGVFKDPQELRTGAESDAGGEERLRRTKVRELLFIYMTLLAARLGFHSMMPLTFNQAFLGRVTKSSTKTLRAWIDLVKLSKTIHASIFSSALIMRELLNTGNYVELLEHFQPFLRQWKQKYLDQSLNEPTKETERSSLEDLLFIEYHYVKMYSNSPAIQAVAQQALSQECDDLLDPTQNTRTRPMNIEEQSGYPFVQDVIHDAHEIVKRALQLAQVNALRFHPARTFHRFITACAFLLKAEVLGLQINGPRSDASSRDLFEILAQSVQALKCSAIDDAHLAAYYAIVLEHHLRYLRSHIDPSVPGDSLAGVADAEPLHQERSANDNEDWHTGWIDPFSQLDLFADFNVFG